MECNVRAKVHPADTLRRLTLAEKEEIVRRFNERVDAAMLKAPPTKEWVKKALSRGGAPRCPVRLRRLSLDIIVQYGDDLADLYCEFPDDVVFAAAYDLFLGYQRPDQLLPISPVEALTEDAWWTDEWGTKWQHVIGGVEHPRGEPAPGLVATGRLRGQGHAGPPCPRAFGGGGASNPHARTVEVLLRVGPTGTLRAAPLPPWNEQNI